MAIRIPIISDFDSRGVEKAVRQFEQLKTTGERAQFGLAKAALPAAAAVAALGAAAVFSAKAAIQDAAAQDQLAGVLRRSTGATTEQVAATEEFITSLSKATATADDELRPALASLAQATGNLGKAQQLLKVSQDLATSSGVDLATASDAVSKAYNGQMKGLATLDPSLRAVIASGASFEQVMAKVAQTTGGAAANAANTTAGRMKNLQIRFGELQEEIGTKLLPVAEKLVGFLTNTLNVVANNVGPVLALATAIGLVATAVIAANIVIKLQAAALVLMKVAAVVATAVNYALATSITAVQLATGVGIIVVAAATAALITYQIQLNKVKNANQNVSAATDETNGFIRTATKVYIELTGKCIELNTSLSRNINLIDTQKRRLEGLAGSFGITTFETGKFSNAVGGGTEKVIVFAQAVKDGITAALDTAKTNLNNAQVAFTTFADTVTLGVKAGLSFADAFKLIDDNGKTFMQNLKDQVEGIKTYAANLQILLTRGLSQDALKYVLDAGGEAGAGIAAELVKGTTDLITGPGGINEMVAAANSAAAAVGMQAATNWYQAGVDQAAAIVDGIDAQLKLLTPKLMARMDKIAAGLARTVDLTVRIKEVVERIIGGAPVTPQLAITPSSMATSGFGGTPLMRNSSDYTINVNGGLSTSAEIGQAVVNSIRAYNRSAGPANIQVAI
jgi:glycine cleavage system H lipoate-binding protein